MEKTKQSGNKSFVTIGNRNFVTVNLEVVADSFCERGPPCGYKEQGTVILSKLRQISVF